MKLYRKICAVISIAIIYALVITNIEFTIWEHIAWMLGVFCYCLAFNFAEDN